MERYFNVTGACNPKLHYMVDLESRLTKIKKMVDQGDYFTINRARQYGKTTTLRALKGYLQQEYQVISLDFQMLGKNDFNTEQTFAKAFVSELLASVRCVPEEIRNKLTVFHETCEPRWNLRDLFLVLSKWCECSARPLVLIVDEVDSASNNQVFLDFLAQLRGYYIHREERPTFQSVILAGVYDVRNIKGKIRSEDAHKTNSPWNIAAEFKIEMSFSEREIAGMLREYEADVHTGMDVDEMAEMLEDYTSGYPFLVSKLCKLMDETVSCRGELSDKAKAWTRAGFLEAMKLLLAEKNTLFESLAGKLLDYPKLRELLYAMLFNGRDIPYNALNQAIGMAEMFGFVKNEQNKAVITNRVFETVLYNLFLSEEIIQSQVYAAALKNGNQIEDMAREKV